MRLKVTRVHARMGRDPRGEHVRGKGNEEADVLEYARVLEMSGRFSEIVITGIGQMEQKGVSFTLVLWSKR